MAPSWLIPAVISSLLGSLIMLVVYLYLYNKYKSNFLLYFVISSVFTIMRFISQLIWIQTGNHAAIFFVQEAALILGYFFFKGVLLFIDAKEHFFWRISYIIIGIQLGISVLYNHDSIWAIIPGWTIIGLSFCFAGMKLYAYDYRRTTKIIGVLLILWGIHKADYPFLRPIAWIAPYGYILGAVFEFLIAMGILIIYFENTLKKVISVEQEYDLLFNSASDAMIIIDHNKKLIRANHAFLKLIHSNSIDDVDMLKIIPEIDKLDNNQELERLGSLEIKLITKYGATLNCLISPLALFEKENEIGYQLKDITELTHYKAHIDLKNKMDTLNVFSGGLAHEINNLLMGINGNLDLMQVDEENRDTYILEMKGIILKAKELIAQIQQLSDNQTLEMHSIDLSRMVDDIIQFINTTTDKSITKINEIERDRYYIKAVPVDLHQIILNLVINSVHAIESRRMDNSHIKFSIIPNIDSSLILFSIEDNGIGMKPEEQSRCFDPFFTTKSLEKKGTGLGLSIVYNLVINRYSGTIEVKSTYNKGTQITIGLPSTEKDYMGPTFMVKDIENLSGEEKILIIEDELYTISILKNYLERLGYTVDFATDGELGLKVFREKKYDLVILDLNLPKISGQEVYKQISAESDCKIVISSGYLSIDTKLMENASGILSKPYELEKLAKQLRLLFS
ncbi:MAG: response regulator [Candidatus Heimdallarchaeota archaeon]|nr:response regulator [Candidatus Heimdallarchaeota archaeon]